MNKLTKLVAATGNRGKLREIRDLLSPLGVEVLSQGEAGFAGEIVEDGATFEENALIKARAVARATGLPAIADDSGLCVDALHGAPGIYSARYAGEDATDADRIALLLRNMAEVPDGERGAHFVSALAFCTPEGEEFAVRGECHGSILRAPQGTLGFGYDPVFFDPRFQKSFGEIDPDEKNRVSHRAAAMTKFFEKIKEWDG